MRTRPRSGASSSRKGGRIEGIIEVVERVTASYFEHRMATYAAALAYRGLFGLFPFILLLVALHPSAADRQYERSDEPGSAA